MKQIAIVGGGITGLSAAFYLEQARRTGAPLKYTLFEATNRLGGVLLSDKVAGCLVEAGADSFLSEKPWASDLCRDLGIGHQLIGSNDALRKTFVVQNGKLVPLPAGMVLFVPTDLAEIEKSQLFSAAGKQRIVRETLMSPQEAASNDVAVSDFVERHFGTEMLERVADPLLAGIYGGDVRKLSMRAVMPRLVQVEQHAGSLIRGLRTTTSKTSPQAVFTSLTNGMQQLVEGVAAQIEPGAVHMRDEVKSLEHMAGRWRLRSHAGVQDFDHVILVSPAHAAARLLRPLPGRLASLLGRIEYSSSVTATMGYAPGGNDTKKLCALEGFGFLSPHIEGRRLLACTFVHNKFPQRVAAEHAVLRVFYGGTRDEGVLQLGNEEIVGLASRELQAILNFRAEPQFVHVHRWPQAMPQYNVGHGELLRQIEIEAAELPGLLLTGSAFRGLGISDCVRQGREAALQVTAKLGDAARVT
jgi:oxygen-dependent protoporphyrinogen oxidase